MKSSDLNQWTSTAYFSACSKTTSSSDFPDYCFQWRCSTVILLLPCSKSLCLDFLLSETKWQGSCMHSRKWQEMWRLKKVTASWCVNTFQIRSVDLRKRSEEQKYAGFLSGISWTTFVVRGVVLCLIADRMHFALLLMARYILRAPLWCWFIIPNLHGLSSVKQICSPLKINGLKINFPFGIAYFQRRTISFRGVSIYVSLNLHLFQWLTPPRIFQQKPPIIELMTCPGWSRPILSF